MKIGKCRYCGKAAVGGKRGPEPRWCSAQCKQAAHARVVHRAVGLYHAMMAVRVERNGGITYSDVCNLLRIWREEDKRDGLPPYDPKLARKAIDRPARTP